MDCLNKKISFVSLVFLSVFLFMLFPVNAYADYSSVSLSPSSGTIYGDSTGIVLNVNSGSDEYIGIDVNISFTGSVTYLSATESKCSSFQVTPGEGTLNVECIFIGDGTTYSGPVATMYFKGTAEGSSTFTFTSTDPNTTSKSGGSYTVTTTSTPSSGGETGASLPQTGIFNDSNLIIIGGFLLIFAGVFFNRISKFTNFLALLINNHKERTVLARDERRRENLEKKF